MALSRRAFLALGSASALSACGGGIPDLRGIPNVSDADRILNSELEWGTSVVEPSVQEPYSFTMDSVAYYGDEPNGTILINIEDKYLYLINGGNTAMRYPIAVGREGKQDYDGEYIVARKVEGPTWTPTAEMVANNSNLEAKTYPAGPNNPLGTHAVYFDFVGGGDSQLRAHGTNAPESIGTEASSGCFRMYNSHAENLYYRVDVGARVKTYTHAGMTPGISYPQSQQVGQNNQLPGGFRRLFN